jgi:hypothetical protein
MANIFANLPVPIAPGIGAAVSVSGFSPDKTLVLEGPGGIAPSLTGANGVLILEASDDGVHYAPLFALDLLKDPKIPSFTAIAAFMRVRRASGFGGGIILGVGGEGSSSNLYATLTVPGSGTGPGTNVSALGVRKTLIVSGDYQGVLVIEGAVDAGATYDPILTCNTHGSGVYVFDGAWQFMRVRRVESVLGSPSVTLGAHPIGGTGSAGVNSCILFFAGSHNIPGPNGVVPDPFIDYFANAHYDAYEDPWYFCLPAAGLLSGLRVYVSLNDCDGITTVSFLLGVTPTTQTVIIPAGATGTFITVGAAVPYALNDQLALQFSTADDSGSHFLMFTANALFTIS